MCGNGFLHSHFLPFPCNQFPFLPIPIPMQRTEILMNLLAIYVEKTKSAQNCNTRVMRLNRGMHRPIRDKCVQPVM